MVLFDNWKSKYLVSQYLIQKSNFSKNEFQTLMRIHCLSLNMVPQEPFFILCKYILCAFNPSFISILTEDPLL